MVELIDSSHSEGLLDARVDNGSVNGTSSIVTALLGVPQNRIVGMDVVGAAHTVRQLVTGVNTAQPNGRDARESGPARTRVLLDLSRQIPLIRDSKLAVGGDGDTQIRSFHIAALAEPLQILLAIADREAEAEQPLVAVCGVPVYTRTRLAQTLEPRVPLYTSP